MHVEHTLAREGAIRLWTALRTRPPVRALGALTGNQAVQQVTAGLQAIYCSGWQVAADANTAGQMYPDQSLYPSDSVPALVKRINQALQRADQIAHLNGDRRIADWFAFDRVLASLDCVDCFNQKVINASMGSFSRVPFFSVTLSEALAHCPVPVLGCELAGNDVHQLPPLTDAVVVIGSEGRGLSPETLEKIEKELKLM